jgi:predicted transposase/invertase (TIGR01784 family)
MILGIDPKVDYAFKWLFGREQNVALLISLLNAVLQRPPTAEVVAVEILNPFQEKELEADKLTILDIKARDPIGRLFNVKMQLLVFGAFRPRVLYYWAKLHREHLGEGEDYAALRPTVTIVFVNEKLFPAVPNWHSVFELRERETGVIFSDQLQLHVLEIPKFSLTADELRTPLEQWMYFLKHGAELDPDHLPQALRGPDYQQALEEMKQMTQSELERERYESRLKAQRDLAALLQDARSEGLAQGRSEALAEARSEGLVQGRSEGLVQGLIRQIHLCQRVLQQPMTANEQLHALPLPDLERLAQDLEDAMTRGRQRNAQRP